MTENPAPQPDPARGPLDPPAGGATPPPYGATPPPPPYGQQPYPQQPYPQQSYPQQPYPQQPPSGYPPQTFGQGQPGQTGQPGWVQPHPKANTALILGIIAVSGFVLCGLTLLVGPFAWATGARVRREIDAAPQQYGGRSEAVIGMVCGIVATAALALGLLALVFVFGAAVTLG